MHARLATVPSRHSIFECKRRRDVTDVTELQARKTLLSMHGTGKAMILRVSEDTFAVRSGKSCQQHPLGILHVRVSKRLSLNGDTSGPTASGLSLPPYKPSIAPAICTFLDKELEDLQLLG